MTISMDHRPENVGIYRPWLDKYGNSCVTVDGVTSISKVKAPLTKEQWMNLDQRVAAARRLPIIGYLLEEGLGFKTEGLKKTTLEYRTQSGTDTTFSITTLPLPMTHAPFDYSPQSYEGQESLVKAVADVCNLLEQVVLGQYLGQVDFESGRILGFCNHPNRMTRVLADVSNLTREYLLNLQLEMFNRKYYGPYTLICGEVEDKPVIVDSHWDILRKVEGFKDRIVSPNLPKDQLVIFQATPAVIRIVEGLALTTVYFDGQFQLWAILVPNLRVDSYDNLGVLHVAEFK